MSRILIAGGGTAGHVVPALALADVLAGRGHQIAFCGTERGMEKHLVPRAGYPFSLVRIRGFPAQPGALHPPNPRLHPAGGRRCLEAAPLLQARLCDRRGCLRVRAGGGRSGARPDPGCGRRDGCAHGLDQPHPQHDGGQGLPVVPAARRRIGASTCTRVGRCGPRCSAPPGSRAWPASTSMPGGRSSWSSAAVWARARSTGPPSTPSPGRRHRSRSFTSPGEREYPTVAAELERPGANPDYQAFPFLDDFPLALAAADAVVGRAGGSVAEILARGVPSLLVPYPYAAGDHQSQNARMVEAEGAALVIADADLDAERLASAVATLLDPEVNQRMRAAALRLARPDAADRIADVVVELVAARAERGHD